MDLSPSPIQSYQKNQNLAGWVQQNEASAAIKPDQKDTKTDDMSTLVTISEQRKIYDWLAGELPLSSQDPAIISRAGQQLYDYGILTLGNLNMVNTMLADQAQTDLLSAIDVELQNAESYRQRENLNQLKRVFNTLQAAEMRPVA